MNKNDKIGLHEHLLSIMPEDEADTVLMWAERYRAIKRSLEDAYMRDWDAALYDNVLRTMRTTVAPGTIIWHPNVPAIEIMGAPNVVDNRLRGMGGELLIIDEMSLEPYNAHDMMGIINLVPLKDRPPSGLQRRAHDIEQLLKARMAAESKRRHAARKSKPARGIRRT